MVTRLESRQSGWMLRLGRLLFAGALSIGSITSSWALAQSTDDSWAEPLNLSHSGVAVNPAVVIDSGGVVHAVWQDDLADFVYTRLDGDEWSPPATTNLNLLFSQPVPGEAEETIYTGPNPLFIAGPGQYIFAFWISPEGGLFTSKVENLDFGDLARWDSGRPITPEAASFAVAVDTLGEWHLAYYRPVDDPVNPAGIYYTRSKNNGGNWDVPVLLYESPYLRTLVEGEANLSIATAGTESALHVYVAWDNRPRKQVLLTQSADGGESWEQPAVVAGPAPGSGLAGPFNIHVGANQESVLLIWQSGQPGGSCSQIYQSSRDAGANWSDPQPMLEDLPECPHSNQFVAGLANNPRVPPRLYLLTQAKSQVLLTAWNGLQWSQPQVQPILSGFEEPEIYTEVIYACHRASLSGERLYVIGCDEGEGGDVWITSRGLDSATSWFAPPVWSPLSPVTSDNLEIEAIELIATEDGLIHAFLNQRQDPAIYYTYWDGELWSPVIPVLELPEGEAAWPAMAAGPDNELFLIAPNNEGALYFSRAASGNAATKSRWSPPTPLPTGHDGETGLVDIAWDAAGTIYVAYSVPVNEERGIYLVQSEDQGTSWSEPIEVFDGAAAGFDLVGSPSLLTSQDSFLHIIWKEHSIQANGVPQPLSLYYTRSEDGGSTFREAELVVEEPVTWQQIVVDDQGILHLLWQDTMTTVWDQVSLDGGLSWQIPQGWPYEGTTAAIMVDSVGRLHLVDAGPGSLDHWLWDGSRWQPETPLGWSLASPQEGPPALLASAVNKQGSMVILLAVPTGAGDVAERMLLYSNRTLELSPGQTASQEVPTQTLLPPALTAATSTPERSSTPAGTVDSEPTNPPAQTDRNETNNQSSPFAMALVSVALLLLSVLGIVVWRARRVRDQ